MPGAEKEQRMRIRRRIDHPDRREPEGAAVDHRTGSQRDEQRRRLDERHHNAVDSADRQRDSKRQDRRPEDRHAHLHLDQPDRPGTCHDGDLAEVDAAADHDQAHAETEDAKNGDAAHQVQQIGDAREARQGQAEQDEQRDRDEQYDLFLRRLLQKLRQQTAR